MPSEGGPTYGRSRKRGEQPATVSADESCLVVGSITEWLRSGGAAAAQAEVATLANLAISARHRYRPYALQGTVRDRNDRQPASPGGGGRIAVRGHDSCIHKANIPVRAIAVWLVRRVTTAAKHYAPIIARSTARIERKMTRNDVGAVALNADNGCCHG